MMIIIYTVAIIGIVLSITRLAILGFEEPKEFLFYLFLFMLFIGVPLLFFNIFNIPEYDQEYFYTAYIILIIVGWFIIIKVLERKRRLISKIKELEDEIQELKSNRYKSESDL